MTLRLARALGATFTRATFNDNTPNTALAVMIGKDGRKLVVDFLGALIGLNQDEVRKLAVPIEVEGEPPLWVMHPILCLQSRLANLHRLSEKRTGNGIAQARVAVHVAQALLAEHHDAHRHRAAGRLAKRISRIAASAAGVFTFFEYEIDPLSAITPARFPNQLFRDREWPKLCRRPQYKREIEAERRRARSQRLG
jgi:hypothetical protein